MAGMAAVKFRCCLFVRAGECDDDPAGRTGVSSPGKVRAGFIKESGGQVASAVAEIIAKVTESDPICEGEIKSRQQIVIHIIKVVIFTIYLQTLRRN